MNPQRTGTLVQPTHITKHNYYSGELGGADSLASTDVLAVPSAAVPDDSGNRTPPPKPWQPLPGAIADAQAAKAVELHPLDLGDGEQGVGHESVIAEHGVIEAPNHPDSVEPRTKTVGDVLRHAARIIEERGWNQGSYELDGRLCPLGAINTAAGGSYMGMGSDHGRDAAVALSGLVGSIIDFNDTPGRTAAEVIAALNAAADEADR